MTLSKPPYPATEPLGSGVDRAIAFGGGGEWFTGFCLAYIHTLAENGIDLADADLTVGTSAGSAVGAIVTSGHLGPMHDQWRRLAAHPEVLAAKVKVDKPVPSRARALQVMADATSTDVDTVRDIGRAAMAAHNEPVADYIASVHELLGGITQWPAPHHTTAVDCFTGERLIVGPDSGIPIEVAVSASSSLPGENGPTWLDDCYAMDGGVSPSSTHADLLVGARHVIIFTLMSLTAEKVAHLGHTPFGLAEKSHPGNANAEKEMIEKAGGSALVVAGNPPAGIDFMDPYQLADAMNRGAARAVDDLDAVRQVWND